MISKFTSIVLRGLSLHVLIAPTIAMNYLPDVINTLNHFVLSVANRYKKIIFILILNFCRTLLGSSGSTIKTVLVEAHFSTIIDIVLAHLTYTICTIYIAKANYGHRSRTTKLYTRFDLPDVRSLVHFVPTASTIKICSGHFEKLNYLA